MSGRWMSSVITLGRNSRVIVSADAPVPVTRPLKPHARAASSITLAKPISFSTISITRSPVAMSSRSSSAALANTTGGSVAVTVSK